MIPPLLRWTVLLCAVAGSSTLALAQDHPVRKIAFERGDGVWVANLDGTSPRKIANGQTPDLSPDGARLAYNTSDYGAAGSRHIAVADLATGTITVFKNIPSDNCMEPCWSPDGKQLLFELFINNEWRLGLESADGHEFRYVEPSNLSHHDYWSVAWAPDGESFYAQDLENLYRLDLNAKILKKWSITQLVPGGDMSSDERLDASPDGKYLLMGIGMDEEARKNWEGPLPAIWLLDLATEKATRLTPKSLYAWDGHWLDAPNSILFTSEKAGEETPSIYRMSVTSQGSDRKLVLKNASRSCASR